MKLCRRDFMRLSVRRHKGTGGDILNGGLSSSDKGLDFSASPEPEAASGRRFQGEDSEKVAELLVGEVAFAEHVDVRP